MPKVKRVYAWIDGSASPNPGKGGWACALIYEDHGMLLADRGPLEQETNNRMEATALLQVLKSIKQPCMVQVYTDSTYLVKCMDIIQRGVSQRTGELPKKNKDLWAEIRNQYIRHVTVSLEWLRAHEADTHILQQFCDHTAKTMSQTRRKPVSWRGNAQELYDDAYRICQAA